MHLTIDDWIDSLVGLNLNDPSGTADELELIVAEMLLAVAELHKEALEEV